MTDAQEILQPLLTALSGQWRLTASPTGVRVDGADGTHAAEVAWAEGQHRQAVELLAAQPPGIRLGSDAEGRLNIAAEVVDGRLLLRQVPEASTRLSRLADRACLSALAGQLLDATVRSGRNILVCGPQLSAVELICGIVAGGSRGVGYGGGWPLPWPQVDDVSRVRDLGADRVAVVSGDAATAAKAMGGLTGVAAWIDSTRLDRAMMRFELAAGGVVPVLAALDLCVVMARGGQPRVGQIWEFVADEDSYQGRLLFSTGVDPAPQALTPVAQPSFLQGLAAAGDGAVAEELRHAAPAAAQTRPQPAAPAVHVVRTAPTAQAAQTNATVPAPRAPVVPSISNIASALDPEAPPPGWELDQLGAEDEPIDEEDDATAGHHDADGAAMAATYGLAPPPRPAGAASEPGLTRGFAEALARARDRDAQLQESLSRPDHGPDDLDEEDDAGSAADNHGRADDAAAATDEAQVDEPEAGQDLDGAPTTDMDGDSEEVGFSRD